MNLAAVFLFVGCVILTFAPAVRFHTWQVEYRWQQWVGFVVWLFGFSFVYRQANRFLPDRDPYLLPIISLMVGWGLLTIFRLDPVFGYRQTIWLSICLAGFIIGLRIPGLLSILRRYKYIWLTLGLLLTLFTFFYGTYPGGKGPNLWLGCCGIYLQPSEFLKFLLIIYLAAYLADSLPSKFRLIRLLTPTLLVAGSALLILIAQRDLGTAFLFIALYAVVIYLASGKRRVLLFSFITVLCALIAGYLIFDVIQLRIEAWLNPWLDPNGRSFQIVQSIISVANGGIFGRGIGLGSPGVIPIAHSDFIFPSIVEETGLFGAVALVILYAFFTIRGFSVSLHAPNQFQRFLAAGITAFIITQSILIMGGTIRLLPLTGVTLPFISYGGSSLVTSFFSAMLLMIISNQAEDQPAVIYQSKPYLFIGTVFLAGLVAIVVLTTWWIVVRADGLLARNDNPRRFISDQYVQRGKILDRNNKILAETLGEPGNYTRVLHYPPLSAVVGYSNSNYGQGGLEASMDAVLRGVQGNSLFTIFSTRLLAAQYPVGLDIRLSLDLQLQQIADSLMQTKKGGLVLLNAETGEVLVMSTAPSFDSNSLQTNWETWKASDDSPLLNRVTQGQYPPGAATGGLVLAQMLARATLPVSIPSANWSVSQNESDYCAVFPGANPTWEKLISSGCTAALTMINKSIQPTEMFSFYQQVGFFDQPDIPVESVELVTQKFVETYNSLFTGGSDLLVSPLQVAVAAASLSNGGMIVSPQIATAYLSPNDVWLLFPAKNAPLQLTATNSDAAAALLSSGTFPGWEILAVAKTESGKVDWYVAGTPPEWQGTPLTIVVALENSTPTAAQNIGRQVFNAAIN